MNGHKDMKEEIARVAYEIYERTGIAGREVENWFEAERIVFERLSIKDTFQPSKKSVHSGEKGGSRKRRPSRSQD